MRLGQPYIKKRWKISQNSRPNNLISNDEKKKKSKKKPESSWVHSTNLLLIIWNQNKKNLQKELRLNQ